ncbi:MAG: metallopeptidase [Chthoniobacter sp.]|uniref:metallopeptidase n=1 Tax=Chthoniobacter sp. TaxID=2510640 RepID=UPI0032A46B58
MIKFLCLLVLLLAAVVRGEEPPKPTSRGEVTIAGWTVRIDQRLLSGPDQELGQRAMKLLESRLTDIAMVVMPDRLAELRTVPIVLDLTHGGLTGMQYHPNADWLEQHGYSRELAKCVHISDATRFTSPRHQHIQPWCVLHELAHAYHDRVLGFNDPRIHAAWQRYVASGHGAAVLHMDSPKRVPHYALTNEKEFFAEMSEAYFGVNDFFPFTNVELHDAEPEIYALLAEIWGPVP